MNRINNSNKKSVAHLLQDLSSSTSQNFMVYLSTPIGADLQILN